MAPKAIPVNPEEADALGGVLARAFIEDPGCRHIFPERDRYLRKMQSLFSRGVRLAAEYGVVYTTPERSGAALWLSPDAKKTIGLRELIHSGFLFALVRLAPGELRCVMKMHYDAVARIQRHVKTPHWVLDTLGVAPEYQGQGVAGALIQVVLEQADAVGIPCYVITHKLSNITLYKHFGFEVVESSQVQGLNIIVTSLRRKPRRSDSGNSHPEASVPP
jgi:GNAT superfamily N-acetyltransferase